MRPSNIIIVSLIQSGLGWWARSLTLVNHQATSLQDSPQLLCQSETVSEVAQVCESPFWGTHLAYKRAPMRKRGPWPHPDTLSFSSLVSFRLNLALEPNSVQLVDQVANTELPSSLPDPSLKPASGKHGFSVAQCPCRHPASSSVRGLSVLFNIGFTKKMSNSIKRKYWK